MKNIFTKIGKGIKFVWDWLVYSSQNAQNISLMIKSIGLAAIPALLIISNTFNIQLTNEALEVFIQKASEFVIVIGTLVAAIGTVVGAARKIFATLNGTNDVIANYKRYGNKGL